MVFWPAQASEVVSWYSEVLGLARSTAVTPGEVTIKIRQIVAEHISQLLEIGLIDCVVETATNFANHHGWPEGWIGVRKALKQSKDGFSVDDLSKVMALEQALRPSDLSAMIRTYVLPRPRGALDIADADSETNTVGGFESAQQRVHDLCVDLGKQLAERADVFDALVSEILASESNRTLSLVRGLALGCSELTACWLGLRDALVTIPSAARKIYCITGFFVAAAERDSTEVEEIFDSVMLDSEINVYLPHWQAYAGDSERAFERILKALDLAHIPASSFRHLPYGPVGSDFNDDQFAQIFDALINKKNDWSEASELFARVRHVRDRKEEPSDVLRASGRFLLSTVVFEKYAMIDYRLGEMIAVSFDNQAHEDQVRLFCQKISRALSEFKISGGDLEHTTHAIVTQYPSVALDMFLETSENENSNLINLSLFDDLRLDRGNPFQSIPFAVLMQWAKAKPESRYQLLGKVVSYEVVGAGTIHCAWSSQALDLLAHAPNPLPVLEVFYQRFSPRSWTGSRADHMAPRKLLLDALKSHQDDRIANWAISNAVKFEKEMDSLRLAEARQSRLEDETFE